MARRRFLGAIDILISNRIEVEKLIPPTTLTKIDTIDSFSADTLTGINNLTFGSNNTLQPSNIEVAGSGNHIKLGNGSFLKLHGTNHNGVAGTFRIEIEGGTIQIIPEA